ncbi:MAG: peptide chain release factor N(5)-glutamine methyltransferase [Candidatus Acidiferrales bacterium]
MNVRTALSEAIVRLESESVPSAALAAELLLLHTMKRDRTWIYAHPEAPLSGDQWQNYFALVSQRAAGTPVQYLTGTQEFWGLEFEVTPDVLIPRPETEHVVEVALARLGARKSETLRVADVGTGSGCLAVALATELPRAHIFATDISAPALGVARRNAARHGVAGRIEFLECNLLDAFSREGDFASTASDSSSDIKFDMIVSNPPYVALADAASLQREVREHEPRAALFAGETGLDVYTPLIRQARELLPVDGVLVVELGYNAAEHVRSLLATGWRDIAIANDLASIARVASATRA